MTIILALAVIFITIFLLNRFYRKNWSENLSVTLSFSSKEVYETDTVFLEEVIKNKKIVPVPILEVDFNLSRNLRFKNKENNIVSDKLYRRDIFSLGSRQQITRRHALICMRRGVYDIDSAGITSYDLILKKKLGEVVKQSAFITVYPLRISSRRLNPLYKVLNGDLSSSKRLIEDPFEFNGIRDYIPGDSVKTINWKASAKSSSLVVNKYSSTEKKEVTVILDYSDDSTSDDYDLNEECIRLTASLCERFILTGIQVRLISNMKDCLTGDDIYQARIGSVKTCLTFLAKAEIKTYPDFEKYDSEISGSENIILITKNIHSCPASGIIKDMAEKAFIIVPYKNEKPVISDPVVSRQDVIFWEYYEGN